MSIIKNNKILYLLLIFCISTIHLSAQERPNFFQAKSDINIERNGKKEDFTAHIRFNLQDTLWISFTGTLGIEGARMLMTLDSTFIINKLEKTAFAYPTDEVNDLIPYSFTIDDWKIILLNQFKDTISETIEEENKVWQIQYEEDKIKKLYFNKNQLTQCKFNNTRNGMTCQVEFSEFESKPSQNQLAIFRKIKVESPSDETVHILIKYVDYKFNQPQPFVFNFAKYKNGEQ